MDKLQALQEKTNKLDEAIAFIENLVPTKHLSLVSGVAKSSQPGGENQKAMAKDHAFLSSLDMIIYLYYNLKLTVESEDKNILFIAPDKQKISKDEFYKGYLSLMAQKVYNNLDLKIKSLLVNVAKEDLDISFVNGYRDYILRPRFLATHDPELWDFLDKNIFV